MRAYPILTQSNEEVAGGSESQLYLISRELKNEGFDVCFVTSDFGQVPVEIKRGVRIIKSYKPNEGIKILRFFYPNMYSIMKALQIANADIYHQRGAGALTGEVALFCSIKKRRFVFSTSHDDDCDLSILQRHNIISKYIYKFGLKKADKIITQTEHQHNLMRKNLNKESIVIKNGFPLPEKMLERADPPIVLWVGGIRKQKRPELFLKLARSIPDARFQMIGDPAGGKPYFDEIKISADKIPNLDFVGFVPFHEVNRYFDDASIFVNTSVAEGFPNTFIQSWSKYAPTISLNVDPDECICKNELGFHSKTMENLIFHVRLLLNDNNLRKRMGENAKRYSEKEHDIKKIVKEYIRLYDELSPKVR